MRIPLPCLLLAVLGACTTAPPQLANITPALTPPPGPRSQPITAAGYHNETSIAIDPSDTRRMVAAWQIPATTAWSTDSGTSWQWARLPDVGRWQLSGDPMVSYDGDGHAYVVYIAFDRPEDYDTLGRAAHRNAILVNRSSDGGRTWHAAPTVVIEQPERPGIPFEDKPAIGIDRTMDAHRRGSVYVAWTEFRRHESVILFSRSVDTAATFSPPIRISARAGSPKDSVGADEGTSITVGRDGTVYVVWSDSIGIHLVRSTDAGRSFGADILVARTPDIVFDVAGVARVNGYPTVAMDVRGARLYVAWVDPRLGKPEPFLATSDDGGNTWSVPIPVAGSDTTLARFFASLAVDPRTGLVAVGYYRVARGSHIAYMLATSTDHGSTFREQPWGEPPFNPAGEFLGDYTGVDAYGGEVAAAWTEVVRPDSASGPTGMGGRHDSRVMVGRTRIGATGSASSSP